MDAKEEDSNLSIHFQDSTSHGSEVVTTGLAEATPSLASVVNDVVQSTRLGDGYSPEFWFHRSWRQTCVRKDTHDDNPDSLLGSLKSGSPSFVGSASAPANFC